MNKPWSREAWLDVWEHSKNRLKLMGLFFASYIVAWMLVIVCLTIAIHTPPIISWFFVVLAFLFVFAWLALIGYCLWYMITEMLKEEHWWPYNKKVDDEKT